MKQRLFILCYTSDQTYFLSIWVSQFLSAGHAHITKSSFLLQLFRIISADRHITWEQSIFHSRKIYMWKFQTFRTVKSHKDHVIPIFRYAVDISDKSHLFKETAQRRSFSSVTAAFLIYGRLTDKLSIFCSCFFRIIRFQTFRIPCLLDHFRQKICHPALFRSSFKIFDQSCK